MRITIPKIVARSGADAGGAAAATADADAIFSDGGGGWLKENESTSVMGNYVATTPKIDLSSTKVLSRYV